MSLPIDTGREGAAGPRVKPPRAQRRTARGAVPGFVVALATTLVLADPAHCSTPASFDTRPEELPQFTPEIAARDPLGAEARCRSFLTALYHRLRTQGANPAWDPGENRGGPLDWVMEAYFALPPASAGVRAADVAAGDQTRAYLDAFGPAALADALPNDPLYRNDKTICDGVLGLARN